MKLTDKTVNLPLPAGKADHLVFDDMIPGFGLRLREGGSKSWIFQYKLGGKQRRMVLGRATAIKAEKARKIAEQYHAQVGHECDRALPHGGPRWACGALREREVRSHHHRLQ